MYRDLKPEEISAVKQFLVNDGSVVEDNGKISLTKKGMKQATNYLHQSAAVDRFLVEQYIKQHKR